MGQSKYKTRACLSFWVSFAQSQSKISRGTRIIHHGFRLILHHSLPLTMVCLLLGLPLSGQSVDVPSAARPADEHYNRLTGLKGSFIQICKVPTPLRIATAAPCFKNP